jgi:small subunit ribosomal protein S2
VAQPGIKELLEAGVHFGHQTRRWNPKMRRFLHGERDGIYIIDLLKTKRLLDQASEFAGTVAHRGGSVLFVGTKKQARDAVREVAEATGMPYVNHRWLGGLLTNFQTMSERIRRLHDLERYEAEGQLALLPTRERLSAQADLAKLRANLGGVKNMKGTPAAIFVIDLKTEAIAVREAQRLRIPIIGLVDTNCDPDGIDFVIPGNDDAIRSCATITRAIGERVGEGAGVYRAEQERLRAEAEERARREAEERARREAEQAAEAAAAQEAEAAAAAARAAAAEAAALEAPPSAPPAQEAAAPRAPAAEPAPAAQEVPTAPPEPVEVPAAPVEAPEVPVEVPAAPVEAPEVPVEVPAAPAEAPEVPVEVPAAPAEAPEVPVEVPAAPAEAPEVPVEVPAAPAEAPEVPVEVPVEVPAAPAEAPEVPVEVPTADPEPTAAEAEAPGEATEAQSAPEAPAEAAADQEAASD